MIIKRRHLAIAAAAAAAWLTPSMAAADVAAGISAWRQGNYEAAIREWRPLAERGDADAQFNLGQAYKLGRGVPLSLQQAQLWYERAARQGHDQAQASLGLILFQNGRRREAMPWIERAAAAGDPRAQYVLATALFNGDLMPADPVRAYALMSRAAAQGLPPAATSLRQMEEHISPADRQRGVAMARQMDRGAAPAAAAPPPRVTAAPSLPPAATQRPPARQAPPPVVAARPAPPAPAPAARPAGNWRVQLGAFSTPDNARRHWEALRGRARGFGSLQPFLVRAGNLTRLQAGPFASRAAADQACAAARAAGAACFPVGQ